jgi:hypothetical protein
MRMQTADFADVADVWCGACATRGRSQGLALPGVTCEGSGCGAGGIPVDACSFPVLMEQQGPQREVRYASDRYLSDRLECSKCKPQITRIPHMRAAALVRRRVALAEPRIARRDMRRIALWGWAIPVDARSFPVLMEQQGPLRDTRLECKCEPQDLSRLAGWDADPCYGACAMPCRVRHASHCPALRPSACVVRWGYFRSRTFIPGSSMAAGCLSGGCTNDRKPKYVSCLQHS